MLMIQLPNGKTIFKTLEEWLDMTPEEYQDMIASNEGFEVEDPFDNALDRMASRADRREQDFDTLDLPDELKDDEIKKIDPNAKA